MSTDITLLKQ